MKKYWPTLLGLLAGLGAIGAGLASGSDLHEGWNLAARWTARVSFPFFILTFIASALVRLYPSAWTRALLRDRRWWGLGFAAAFLAHLAALLVNNWLRDNFPPASLSDPGPYVYLLLLAMVLTSTNAARKRMGGWWKLLHRLGMWAYWAVFAISPYLGALHTLSWPEQNPLRDPYFIVGIGAALLKLAAAAKARRKKARR
jgi:DMSO/TMAO reductase YedYZ heme-binding membrane subunit